MTHSNHTTAEAVYNDTIKSGKFKNATGGKVEAKVGDRLIYMIISGDIDILEVVEVAPRARTVIGKALGGESLVLGSLYRMPRKYFGGSPVLMNMSQVRLMQRA